MVFNAVVGNDDDHPRNHAAIFNAHEGAWRLSPAFDVVPNPDVEPQALAMQLSEGRFDISRKAILADSMHFGFEDATSAEKHLDDFLSRIKETFYKVEEQLAQPLRQLLLDRIAITLRLLA